MTNSNLIVILYLVKCIYSQSGSCGQAYQCMNSHISGQFANGWGYKSISGSGASINVSAVYCNAAFGCNQASYINSSINHSPLDISNTSTIASFDV